MTWSEHAACADTALEMWFPRKGNNATNAYTAARWYCERCPVRRPCLYEALRTDRPGARYGMRAGLTPGERDDIANDRAPIPTFPPPHPREGEPMSVTDITQAAPREPISTVLTDVEALIAWGTAHSSSRVQTLAGKARGALADLRQTAERETKVAEAEDRVALLKAQLENAQKDLASAKGTTTPKAGEDYTAIRAWARDHGIEVGAVGRPKREVVEAYHAAHPVPLADAS